MAFADRIRHCNSYDPRRAIPLWAGKHRTRAAWSRTCESSRRTPENARDWLLVFAALALVVIAVHFT